MTNQPSIRKNYIYHLFYEILTLLIPFVTAPYVSRILGADGIGIYSYTQSYMVYFTMFAGMGTTSYGMREIARCRYDKYEYSKKFWEIELLKVFTTCICLFIWGMVVFFSTPYKIYFIALIPSLFGVMFDISWFYTGHEKVNYIVFWNAICKAIGVVCIFIFIKDKSNLFHYLLINTLVLAIGNASMWVFLPKMLIKVNVKEFSFATHFKETLVYFIPTISTSIYTVLDKTLIGIITHDEYENGYYEQASKIINMAKIAVFSSVNSVMGARISYLFVENKTDEIKQRIRKSLNYILLLAFGAMFGIMGIAKTFVPLFFGKGYEPTIYLLYWMAPLIVIVGISNCLGAQYYTPAGYRAQSAKYIIAGSSINLIANLCLIPIWGSIGAVISSLIAEFTISMLYLSKSNGYLTLQDVWTSSYKRILSGLIMLFFINMSGIILKMQGVKMLFIQVISGIFVYFICLIFLKDNLLKELIYIIKMSCRKRGA